MPPAQRRVPRRAPNPENLRASAPVIEDEPIDFVAPRSATDDLKDDIKSATEGTYKPGKYKNPIMQMYGVAALGLMPFLPGTAASMATSAEKCAEEWEKLARRNPAVRKVLDMLTQNTGRFAIAAAHAPIFVAAARETGVADKVMKSSAVKRLMDRFTKKTDEPSEPIPHWNVA